MDRNQGGTLSDSGSDALTLRLLTGSAAEMAALQCVLEVAPAYFQLIGGAPPGGAEAQSLFTALPSDKSYHDKFVWGLYSGAAMIGCADVIRGYRTSEVKPAESIKVMITVLEKPLPQIGMHG